MYSFTSLELLLLNALVLTFYHHGECCSLLKLISFNDYKPSETPLVQWLIPSHTSIACGYLCKRYGGCESFSFNILTGLCTGYSLHVNNLDNYAVESGSSYYHASCNVSEREVFQGFTYSQDTTAVPDAIIPFGNEIAFVGISARLHLGNFICPLSGYYKMIIHAFPQHMSQSVLVELRHNDQAKLSVKSTGNNLAGNCIILFLESGDHVAMYTDITSDAVYGSLTELVTTFSAVLLHNETGAVSVALNSNATVLSGNNVKFDHVITDVMHMYDITTGTVTISTSGLYIVHFFVVANRVALDLYQNEGIVCSTSCHIPGQLASCGNTAILKMVSGDRLTLRSQQGFENQIYGTSGKAYTTMSAHLIATDDDMRISELDCWDDVNPKTYSGNISVSQNGYICQDWTSQTPHPHAQTNAWQYPCDVSIPSVLNRCRDPDSSGYPWCYTTNPALRWEGCNVPICPLGRKSVAFSVGLSKTLTLSGGMNVQFDHIIYGVKCDYTPTNGKFTARVGGLYEFHVTAKGTNDAERLKLELWARINNIDRYLVTVKSEHTGGPTGGNSALIQLNPGDTVVVITATGVVNKLYGNSTELVCVFSGYLVN